MLFAITRTCYASGPWFTCALNFSTKFHPHTHTCTQFLLLLQPIIRKKQPMPPKPHFQGGAPYPLANADEWELSPSHVIIEAKLGMGAFGEVYRGSVQGAKKADSKTVAIKLLKGMYHLHKLPHHQPSTPPPQHTHTPLLSYVVNYMCTSMLDRWNSHRGRRARAERL